MLHCKKLDLHQDSAALASKKLTNRNTRLIPAIATALLSAAADRFLALHLFDDMSPATLACNAVGAHEVVAVYGTLIFRQSDPCRGLYIVDSGQVKPVLQILQGDEKVVEWVGRGDSCRGPPCLSTCRTS